MSHLSELSLDSATEEVSEVEEEAEVIDLTPSTDATHTEGATELAAELDQTADDFDARDFKCVECGLVHGHDTDKHRASDGFAMDHEDAGDMEFNPNCHCGYNELAHRGEEYGVSDTPSPSAAADTAPVPDSVRNSLR